MFKTSKITASLLCLVLLCITAGCGGPASEDGFTLEDMANANTADAIFKIYKNVRSESKFYNLNLPGGEKGDFTQTAVYVKQNDAVTAYVSTIYGDEYAIEQGKQGVQAQVYYKDADGIYGVYAFFDDGYFEEYCLPGITTQILFSTAPELGEKLVSQTVEGGIRKVTTRMDASKIPGAEEMGIPNGTAEFVYGLDAKSGLLQNIEGNIFTNPSLSMPYMRCEVTFGKDNNFQPPDYVTRCKDMTETRTVRYVREPGTPNEKTFTFTLPKSADLYPAVIETYAYFEDAACTVPYEAKSGDYPDELTIYMKEMTS